MRRIAAVVLLSCCPPRALAAEDPCVDVVGLERAPAERVLDDATQRSDSALARMVESDRPVAAAPELGSAAKILANHHRDNLRALKEVERQHLLARLFTPVGSCRLLQAEENFDLALERARHSAERASHYSAQYGLYVGPNFSLGGAGDWRPGAETLARFDTEVFTVRDGGYEWLKKLVPDSGWLRGYSEFSYQSINALEETEDAASSSVPPQNVFASAGGYLRLNTGLQLHFTDWYGVQFGGGLSSLPNADNVTRMEPRAFAGIHFQTLFSDGALAQFFLGGAYDRFWQSEVYNDPVDPLAGTHVENHFARYNVDGLIFLPGQAGNFHLAARLFADAPMDGDGPSDVRVSLLVYYDFNDWLNGFVPIRSVRSVADTLREP